jgi:glycosyltransferase involved in cell wall biosynthesis
MKISALIVARDEEQRIIRTLNSLNFVDEIVLILDRSSDKTKSIAEKYTKKIFEGSWPSEGKRRNYGLSKCCSEWILEIDADEIIGKDLSNEIKKKIQREDVDFYYVPLVNYVANKPIKYGWMACLAPDGKFSLFRRHSKTWFDGSVHPDYKLNGNKGKVFSSHIDHYMSDNISDLLLRFNRNTTLYAQDLKKKKSNLKKLSSIRKVFSRFLKSYITRAGYKSGRIGLFLSVLCSIYPLISSIKSKYD